MKLVHGISLRRHDCRTSSEMHAKLLDRIQTSETELRKIIPDFNKHEQTKYCIIREPLLTEFVDGEGWIERAHSPDFIIFYFRGNQLKMYFVEVKSRANSGRLFDSLERLETDLKIMKDYLSKCLVISDCRKALEESLAQYKIPAGIFDRITPEFRGLYRDGSHLKVYIPRFER